MKILLVVLVILFVNTLALGNDSLPVPTPEPTPIPTPLATPPPLLLPTPFFTPSQTPSPTPERETFWQKTREPKEHKLRFAVSPYYGLGASIQADDISENTNGTESWASGNFPTTMAPGVAIEVYDSPENSFGWSAGASYDFQRIVKGLNASDTFGNQIGGPFISPQTGITFLTIYGNAVYRFAASYFEFGINYTFPNLQGGINNVGSTSLSGGVGVQVAAGVNLSDTFAVEFWLEELSLNGNTNTSTTSLNYSNIYFFNPELRLRISF